MISNIKKLCNQTITRSQARQIVRDTCHAPCNQFQVYDCPQPGWQLYNNWGDEPCWYVTMPGEFGSLQSTKVAVVSRESGTLLAVCSAQDEG